jgi:glycosyltransferase involved in cell wall biosynthesis
VSRYRILRLITWLPSGGIERKIIAVLPRLNRDLFEPHLCCLRRRGPLAEELEAAGVPVHLVRFSSRWDPYALWRLNRFVRRIGADLVHSHMYRSNVPATAMKWLNPSLMVVGQYHNIDTWESRAQLAMDRWLARRRDINIAVSHAVERNVVERLGIPDYLVRTIHNCVDLDEFHPIAAVERHAIRESLGLPAYAKMVVMVARLVPQKNQKLVLHSVAEIAASEPRVHFVFVGDGPDRQYLEELEMELMVGGNVTFLGSRTDVPQLLAAADIAILPSIREGFSNAILEAMASGLPVVASNVGGNREVIDSGISGYLVDAPDGQVNQAQFIRYVKRLVTDDSLRARMSAAALHQVRQFSLDVMVREVEQLYLELLEARDT